MRPVYLVCDSRERHVAPHLPMALGQRGLQLVVGSVTTGDFHICEPRGAAEEPAVLAAFERKTWTDLAEGEKKGDGRSLNVGKLLQLRRECGAQLFYLVEGRTFPARGQRFARFPADHLVTLLTRLTVDHGIFVVQTADPEHSARRLAEFARVFAEPDPFATAPGRSATPPVSPAGQAGPTIPARLTVPIEKPDSVVIALAWANLKGISHATGGAIACAFSIADLALGRVSEAALGQLRGAGGQALKRPALASLRRVRAGERGECSKLLSGVRGLTRDAADRLLAERGLAALCAASEPSLAAIPVARRGGVGRLGPALAKRLRDFLQFKAERDFASLSPEEKAGRPKCAQALPRPARPEARATPGPAQPCSQPAPARSGNSPPNSGLAGSPFLSGRAPEGRSSRPSVPAPGAARPPDHRPGGGLDLGAEDLDALEQLAAELTLEAAG